MGVLVLAAAAVLVGLPFGAASRASAADAGGAVAQLADQIGSVLPADGQVRIVVSDFDDGQGVTNDLSRYLADLLIIRLGRTPRFLPIERRHLRIVLDQLALRSSDLRRLGDARRVAGQFHADVLLLNGLADAGGQVALDTRVLDVATGETLGFASAGVTKDAQVQRMLETGRR
jgi:curli biogenesis system outer membrane secretion channel CsgG